MSWFIKTEQFTEGTLNLPAKDRAFFLDQHISWVKGLSARGIKISSGYLVNEQKKPGGGGLLVLEANSYNEAMDIINKDPMIINDLVKWNLKEWIPVSGKLIN